MSIYNNLDIACPRCGGNGDYDVESFADEHVLVGAAPATFIITVTARCMQCGEVVMHGKSNVALSLIEGSKEGTL
jgi:uncharacterized Zn finger protein